MGTHLTGLRLSASTAVYVCAICNCSQSWYFINSHLFLSLFAADYRTCRHYHAHDRTIGRGHGHSHLLVGRSGSTGHLPVVSTLPHFLSNLGHFLPISAAIYKNIQLISSILANRHAFLPSPCKRGIFLPIFRTIPS